MSQPDAFDRIDALIQHVLDGDLSPEDQFELEQLVKDPEACGCYIRLIHQRATLQRLLGHRQPPSLPQELEQEIQPALSELLAMSCGERHEALGQLEDFSRQRPNGGDR